MTKDITILTVLISIIIGFTIYYAKEPVGLDLQVIEEPTILVREITTAEKDAFKIEKELSKDEGKIFDKVMDDELILYDLSNMNVGEVGQKHIDTFLKVGGEYKQEKKDLHKQMKEESELLIKEK